jgi:hypothetical protein
MDERDYKAMNEELKKESSKNKINIELIEYNYKCGDGCCDNYGTITKVNGVELDSHNQDAATILEQVLQHLGYDVIITHEYDY